MDKKQLNGFFEKLAVEVEKTGKSASLTVIGSVPCILKGEENRMTMDIDVWREDSKFSTFEFQKAVEKAGLLYDPKNYDPGKPYVQIVDRGIVEVGTYRNHQKIDLITTPKLTVSMPPAENLVASKLIRADKRDLEDISFLISTFDVEKESVLEIIKTFSKKNRELALENSVYLEALTDENCKI